MATSSLPMGLGCSTFGSSRQEVKPYKSNRHMVNDLFIQCQLMLNSFAKVEHLLFVCLAVVQKAKSALQFKFNTSA
jgi:hypothetical protein